MSDDLDDIDLFGDRKAFEQVLFDEYCRHLRTLYELMYEDRRAQLRPGGSRNRGFNTAGIHEVSYAWGKVNAMEQLFPELLYLEASLREVREEAVREAEEHALMSTRLGLVLQGAEAPVDGEAA